MNNERRYKDQIEVKLLKIAEKTRNDEQEYSKVIFKKHQLIFKQLQSEKSIIKSQLEHLRGKIKEKDQIISEFKIKLEAEKRVSQQVFKSADIESLIRKEMERFEEEELVKKLSKISEQSNAECLNIVKNIKEDMLKEIKSLISTNKQFNNVTTVKNDSENKKTIKELNSQVKTLEKEISNIQKSKNTEIDQLVKKIKIIEDEEGKGGKGNIRINKNKDTVLLLNSKIKKLEEDLKKKEQENENLKKSASTPFSQNDNELKLPETTIIKNNPYEKSFTLPKKGKKTGKTINVKGLIDKSNNSYFKDLSFNGGSSSFIQKKSRKK